MAVLLVWLGQVFACDCPAQSLDALRKRATHIFVGKVVRVETNWMSGGMKYTFQVSETWQRETDNLLVVNSAFPKQCGYAFQQGETYLVYAAKKFSLRTDACGGSKPLSAAQADLAALGKGSPVRDSPLVSRIIWGMSIAMGIGLLFLAFVVLRGKFNKTP